MKEINTDEYNTNKSFKTITTNILTPIKKISISDYNNLWNTTIHYYKCSTEFSLEGYIDTVIKNYTPFESNVNIENIINKLKDLPVKHKFDNRFTIDKKSITSHFKRSINLTPQLELQFKEDVPDLFNVITAFLEDNKKYIKIRTDNGYDNFKR